MATIIKPPKPLPPPGAMPSVFLAGSIDMGRAEPWQAALEHALAGVDVLVFNPRRDDWDASWVQSITNPKFREQVEWELVAQEQATLIAMYFAPQTQAPVTLLELGLFARSGKLIVCCPDGFWRKGNIEVVCSYYEVPLVNTIEELIARVKSTVSSESWF
jgi:Nucleoside 2-deoxyribosyltransferase like